MTRNDRAALTLAMETCRKEEGRARQLDHMVKAEGWESAARFAAMHCQSVSMDLCPWQRAPASVSKDDDNPVIADAVKLLKKMLAAGVSRYDPDPMRALEQAKQKGDA